MREGRTHLLMVAAAISLALLLSSAALAGTRTPAGEEYAVPPQVGVGGSEPTGPSGCVESITDVTEGGGVLAIQEADESVLPFTGLDLVLLVGVALGVIVLGIAFRRAGRRGAS
jgi:hypothetical protein